MDGVPNDGEKGEGDLVRSDVESTKTGSGNDWINAQDGIAGNVSCGGGTDHVVSDPTDKVSADCELVNVASSRCTPSTSSVRMTSSGSLSVNITCGLAGTGTLVLQASSKALKSAHASRTITLARKRFTISTGGKAKTVKLKLKGKAKRAVLRRKRLSVRAVVTMKPKGATNQRAKKPKRSVRSLTIKAPKKK